MTRKSALYLIVIFFATGIIGNLSLRFGWNNPYAEPMYQYGFSLAEITSIILLLAYGTFLQRKWFKVLFAVFALLAAIGMLFKIFHLRPANIIIVASALAIVLTYSVHFVLKEHKIASDYLKWILVAERMILASLFLLHVIPAKDRDFGIIFSHCFIYVVLGVYLWEEWKYNKLKEEED